MAGCLLVGCETAVLPDPNDPNDVSVVQPDVLRNSLKGASDNLNQRLAQREINQRQYDALMAQYANDLLNTTNIEAIPPSRAWEYAEVFRTAKRWKEAATVLKVAVKAAKSQDRRVNDTLRLAQALAYENEVPEAIQTAKKVFDAPAQEKAPILLAVLYEIVPAARNKGKDVDLATLLEDAIEQAQQTLVDPNSDAGKMFLAARPHHVRNAWMTVLDLYSAAGRDDLAQKAMRRMDAMLSGQGRA